MKIMDDTNNDKKKKKKSSGNLLTDDRFKALFENPDFEVDTNAEEYRLKIFKFYFNIPNQFFFIFLKISSVPYFLVMASQN